MWSAPDRSSRRVCLAGVGGDAHSVGLVVLQRALERAGYSVDYLGAQCALSEICAAAVDADAVLVSNMNGHAAYYLSELARRRADAGDDVALWYLGGNPSLDGEHGNIAQLQRLGFHRVYLGFVPTQEVIRVLDFDLRERRRNLSNPRPSRRSAERSGDARRASSRERSRDATRNDVLNQWSTGHEARDLEENAADLARRPSLANLQTFADETGRTLIHPRSGVATCAEQIYLFREIAHNSTADVLSFQIDSFTRNNDYAGAKEVLRQGTRDGRLNGFPAVNHGPRAMRRIADAVPNHPLQVRHSTRDPRLLAEIAYAGGATAFEGGPICYNLPYFRDYDPKEAIASWRYVDWLTGLYHSRFGILLDREFFGVLTATLVPPCIAIVSDILEALLACEMGVRSVSLGYAEQGNRAQDIAAIRAMKSLGREWLDRRGFGDVAIHTVFHQYMGAFPKVAETAKMILAASAMTARLSGATRLMTKTFVEAMRIPDATENVESLMIVRASMDAAREDMLDSQAVAREQAIIDREVRSILDAVLSLDEELSVCVAGSIERGLFDLPFSPSCWNRGAVITARDSSGAVRFADVGQIPLPVDIAALHADLVKKREALERRPIDELIEYDTTCIAEARLCRWPFDAT